MGIMMGKCTEKAVKRRKGQSFTQYFIMVTLLFLFCGIYQLKRISGMVMYPDEFGYWANAAHWLGYDWSQTVALQSYYSFGYSILLVPFLKLIEDPLVSYRAAALLNILLVYAHALLLWQVAGKLKGREDRRNLLYCLIAALYPGLLFYMQLTLAESLLALLFLLSVRLLLACRENGKAVWGFLFLFSLACLYFVHMRTLGILAAGIPACFLACFRKGRKSFLTVLLLAAAFLALLWGGNAVKNSLQAGLYGGVSGEMLGMNDYQGQAGKLAYLFTLQGLKDFAVSCIGKGFYLGVSTFGTVYLGVWHILKRIKKEPVYFYLSAAAAFTFLVAAIYTIQGDRGDLYVYGRYNETVVPLFVYFGLCEMEEAGCLFRIAGVLAFLQGSAACLLAALLHGSSPAGFQGYFTVGMSGYMPREILRAAEDYIWYPAVLGTAAMLLLAVVMGFFIRRRKRLAWYLVLFAGFYFYTGITAGDKYLYDHSVDTKADMELAGWMKERMGPQQEAVFCLSGSDALYVDILQFCMRERTLHILPEGAPVPTAQGAGDGRPGYVITYRGYAYADELRQEYGKPLSTYHFNLYCGSGGCEDTEEEAVETAD